MPSLETTASGASSASSTGAGLSIAILALAGFVIVTTEFLIIGLLPSMARDLGISISTAGLLVTLFAFTVMLFGPPLTAMLSHLDRKRTFIVILLIFAASNALAAVSSNIWVLALARFIPALALPVFWGTASETASLLAGPKRAGKAVAQVYLGISAAMLFGIPLGTVFADAVGWRGAFWALTLLSALMALLLALSMPRIEPTAKVGLAEQAKILRDPFFLANLLLSILLFTAMFGAYTYLADTLERIAGIESAHVGWWLMGFGAVAPDRQCPGWTLCGPQPARLDHGVCAAARTGHDRKRTRRRLHAAACRGTGDLGHCAHGVVSDLPDQGDESSASGPGTGRDPECLGSQCRHRPGIDHRRPYHRAPGPGCRRVCRRCCCAAVHRRCMDDQHAEKQGTVVTA